MLTDRQKYILKKIIQLYSQTGEPVGSKTLLEHTQLQVGPATIRNEMSKLESLGYLSKTHLSSGRVPSKLGYRYYIENLINFNDENVPTDVQDEIISSFDNPYIDANDLVKRAASILSDLTNFTAISLGPNMLTSHLTGFRIVPLNDTQLIAILVTDKGHVENQLIRFDKHSKTNLEEIEKVVWIINDELVGLDLITVFKRLQNDLPGILEKYVQSEIYTNEILQFMLQNVKNDQFFVNGQTNLIDYLQGEQSHKQFKQLLLQFENPTSLTNLIETHDGDILVKFGDELNIGDQAEISLIATNYYTNLAGKGTIALIGPTNMSYARTINLMRFISSMVTERLNSYYHDLE